MNASKALIVETTAGIPASEAVEFETSFAPMRPAKTITVSIE